MKIFKKLAALILSIAMICSFAMPAFAEDTAPKAPGVSYVFAKFAGGGAKPVGISSVTFDAGNITEKKALAIYEEVLGNNGEKHYNHYKTLSQVTFTNNDNDVFKTELFNKPTNGDFEAIRIVPKGNGTKTLTADVEGQTISIDITMENVQAPQIEETRFAALKMDGTVLSYQNEVTATEGFGGWQIFPYAFAVVEKENPIPEKSIFYPDDLTIEIRDKDDKVLTDAATAETIKLGKDVNNNHVIEMNPHGTPGKYSVWFYYTSPIASENDGKNPSGKKCGRSFVYELLPAPEETTLNVPADYSTIQGAINAAKSSTDDAITIIEVANGTYPEDITIDKKVLIAGESQDGTIIKGSVTFAAPEHTGPVVAANSRVRNLTVKSATTGVGTGVQVKSKCYGDIAGVVIDGFAVGAIKPGRSLAINGTFKNCTVAYDIDMGGFDSNVSKIQAFTFENNDTAIRIHGDATGALTSALLVYNSNFKNNKVNISDDGGSNYYLYVAYNYFAYDDAGFDYDASLKDKFDFANPAKTVSPYYRAPITVDKGIFTYPDKAYAVASELSDLSIDKSMADKPIDTANFTGEVNIKLATISSRTGEPTAVAGWDFAAANPALANTFNPAIATELKDSSSNAVDTLPGGATYQPVSFAHSGALPGTATVNVAKDADAPTQNLKLYKVVGNKLVLQPEAVTFANGEYIFRRDGASDYLITDTDVTGSNDDDDDDDDSSGGSGGSGGSNDYVGSEEINNKLESTTGSNVSISVAGKPIVSASLFDTLKTNPGKTITLKGDGYAWSFKGSDIKGNIPGLISFNTKISSTSPNAEEIKKVTGDAEIVNVYFSYHGQLPGRATVDLAVDKKYNGKTLNFYHYNAAKKQLETVATGLAVKDGKVSVSITHCSDYILSPVALKATAPVTQMVTNPETGAVDRVPLAIAFAVLSCLGALTILRVKKPE